MHRSVVNTKKQSVPTAPFSLGGQGMFGSRALCVSVWVEHTFLIVDDDSARGVMLLWHDEDRPCTVFFLSRRIWGDKRTLI